MLELFRIVFFFLLVLITCRIHCADIAATLDSDDGSSAFSIMDSNSAEQVRITSNGNVSLTGSLIMNGASVYRNADNAVLALVGGSNGGKAADIELYGGTHATVPGKMYLDADEHNFRAANASTTIMHLNALDQEVGIRTTTPQATLEVNGTFLTGISAKTGIESWTAGDNPDTLLPGSTFGSIIKGPVNAHVCIGVYGNDANDSFSVLVDGDYNGTLDTLAFMADSTGFIGINRNNPIELLHLENTGPADDFHGIRITAFRPQLTLDDKSTNADDWRIRADGNQLRFFHDPNDDFDFENLHFIINSNGDISGTHGTYHTASDMRLKKDITTIPNALEKIKALRGVYFRWKDRNLYDDSLWMGMIAQEVENVAPEVIHTANDEMQTKAIQYENLIGLLVQAIKELEEKVEEQEKEIRSLRTEMK